MSNRFSRRSRAKLDECDPRLQRVFERVLQFHDCTILVGHRDKETQNAANDAGKSKVRWPNSKHNTAPSLAVDVAPFPIDWADRDRFMIFAGVVRTVAALEGVSLRWGGDWDGDGLTKDQTFDDLVHWEIVE